MSERVLWLLERRPRYASGAPAAREHMGVFSTPERAFEVVRHHVDFGGTEVDWRPVEWEDGRTAYVGLARERAGRDRPLWELSVEPAVLDEPVFDFRDERDAYERSRGGGG